MNKSSIVAAVIIILFVITILYTAAMSEKSESSPQNSTLKSSKHNTFFNIDDLFPEHRAIHPLRPHILKETKAILKDPANWKFWPEPKSSKYGASQSHLTMSQSKDPEVGSGV